MPLPTPVLITLPQINAEPVINGLGKKGFTAKHFPVFSIQWLPVAPNIEPQFIVVTSPNAVTGALNSKLALPREAHCRYLAVGKASAQALQQAGIEQVSYPAKAGSDGLVELDAFKQCAEQRGWLITGQGGRELIEQQAAAMGASLERVNCYRRQTNHDPKALAQALAEPTPQLAVATSTQALDKLKHMADADCQASLERCHWLVSSPRIATKLTMLWPNAAYTTFTGHQADDIIAACQGWLAAQNPE